MHEAQLYDSNLFVTLTYSPENMPRSLSLEYRHIQLFLKKLRKAVSGVSVAPNGERPIRYFVAGEYGEQYKRPHWHAILFNTRFPDQQPMINGEYFSELAGKIWGHGQVHIGSVTPASAAYVAGYTQSKVYGDPDHYEDVVDLSTGEVTSRRPEFARMSLNPGIGYWWYEKFQSDVLPIDKAVIDGKAYKVPGYYWRKFQETADGSKCEEIRERRYSRAMEVDRAENSERRRSDRAEVAKARLRARHTRKL